MVIDTDHIFKGQGEFGYSKCSISPGNPLNHLDRAPRRHRLRRRLTSHTQTTRLRRRRRRYGEDSGGEERTKGGRREPGQREAKGPYRRTTPADVRVMVRKQTAFFQIQIFSSARFTSARLLLLVSLTARRVWSLASRRLGSLASRQLGSLASRLLGSLASRRLGDFEYTNHDKSVQIILITLCQ